MSFSERLELGIGAIMDVHAHRPWTLPAGVWQYYQEWNDVVFLHWQVEKDVLASFMPSALELDSFEGQYWVSLVAFTMERIRMKNLPAFPLVSNFHEINIRTYVRSHNKSGVYFLSIEAGKRISCSVARRLSGLPYRFSEINRAGGRYNATNKEYNDHFQIQYALRSQAPEKEAIDLWLTERYALFQESGGYINAFEIHHVEWPLCKMNVSALEVSYPRFDQLIGSRQPHKIHYSPGVQVIAWGKNRLGHITRNN